MNNFLPRLIAVAFAALATHSAAASTTGHDNHSSHQTQTAKTKTVAE